MRQWMPLADAILRSVVRCIPDPAVAQANKLSSLFPVTQQQPGSPLGGLPIGGLIEPQAVVSSEMADMIRDNMNKIKQRVSLCDTTSPSIASEGSQEVASAGGDNDDVVVFISKMIPVRVAELSVVDAAFISASMAENTDGASDDLYAGDKEVFLALGRVFAGTLRSHDKRAIHVIGHHYNPYHVDDQGNMGMTKIQTVALPESLGLYMCLGPSVCPVSAVPAGNVVAIFGLHSYILKSATLCSSPYCFPMAAITFQAKPMLRVAVEPVHHNDLRNLEDGMRKLYQYDPVVEVSISNRLRATCMYSPC
jgi:ribosome assembly protein 1